MMTHKDNTGKSLSSDNVSLCEPIYRQMRFHGTKTKKPRLVKIPVALIPRKRLIASPKWVALAPLAVLGTERRARETNEEVSEPVWVHADDSISYTREQHTIKRRQHDPQTKGKSSIIRLCRKIHAFSHGSSVCTAPHQNEFSFNSKVNVHFRLTLITTASVSV
jgi:hypothetical protein